MNTAPDSVAAIVAEMRNFADVMDHCVLTVTNGPTAIRAWAWRLSALTHSATAAEGGYLGMKFVDAPGLPEGVVVVSNQSGEPLAIIEGHAQGMEARDMHAEAASGGDWFGDMLASIGTVEPLPAALAMPDGMVMVPRKMFVEASAWEAASFAFGGPDHGEGDAYMDCTLWIGEIGDDDGQMIHGIHVSCDECPEEGSITLSEFAAAPATPDDTRRLDFMQQNRVGLTPEFEGPWDAEVYGEDATARIYTGATPREAIDAAMIAAASTGDGNG